MQLHGANSYRQIEYFDNILGFRELESLLCGNIINTGAARRVYECRLNAEWVIKREISATSQNVVEAEIWSYLGDDPKIGKWLAPVHFISPCGLYLIQSRTHPVREGERPKRLPAFLDCDLKLDNFGWLGDRLVCHDYGTLIAGLRRRDTRLVKAKWYA